jgi:hypothetical protein
MLSSLLIVTTLTVGQSASPPVPTGLPRFGVPIVGTADAPTTARSAWLVHPGYYGIRTVDGDARDDTKKDNNAGNTGNGDSKGKAEEPTRPGFFYNFCKIYMDEFWPKRHRLHDNGDDKTNGNGDAKANGNSNGKANGDGKDEATGGGRQPSEPEEPEYRRALPSPWPSPPFPGSEYQGYPLIGVPYSTTDYPFMKALYTLPCGEAIKETRIKFDGWVDASGTWSTNKNTNTPASYWIVPNSYQLDQMLFRFQREVDTVQTNHIDWGFRSVLVYGMDYRYTTAGGWFSEQLLRNNNLYGWDPAEQYFDLYIPWIFQGAVLRVGRWIACPDIETQWAPDNYLGSHSILFTYDTYTQTGIMWTQRLTEQWMLQFALHSGTDMAPWYPGAIPTFACGMRWVSKDNNDAFYGWLNALNNAHFRYFEQYGQLLGHDNFNYLVGTYEHRFSKWLHTKTEAYYMWEFNGYLGGTPSAGPVEPFGGGGGLNPANIIPGMSQAYGVLNYTMFGIDDKTYFTVRNEWWRDTTGFRAGFAGNYTSHTIGISHYFNNVFCVRPEIGYYRNWTNPAFDNGLHKGMWMYGFDMFLRF